MSKYIVNQSGPLKGEVDISGAKNAVLPLMAAALLSEEKCIIRDVPRLRDVALMRELLVSLGSEITESGDNILSIETKVHLQLFLEDVTLWRILVFLMI